MEERSFKKKYTPSQAKLKIEQWCAFQERSHKEVRDKLYSFGLYPKEVNDIMAHLIEYNFLNEERFAEAFVSGKFKIKGWGKTKIQHALKGKQVSSQNIKSAMKQVDDKDYFKKLKSLAEKKNRLIKESNPLKRKKKLVTYLASKGYEAELVYKVVDQILKHED